MADPKKGPAKKTKKSPTPSKGKSAPKTTEAKDLPLDDLSQVAGGVIKSFTVGYPTNWKYCG